MTLTLLREDAIASDVEPNVWKGERDPRATGALVDVATEQGVSIATCLSGTGLSVDDVREPTAAVAPVQEIAVIRNILNVLGDPIRLGAEAGSRVRFGMLGGWGHAIRTAPTPADAFRVALDYGYGRFSWVFSRPWLAATSPTVRIQFDDQGLPEDVRDVLVARDLVFTTVLLPSIFTSTTTIHVEMTASSWAGECVERILSPRSVVFGAAADAVVFDAAVMSQKMPHSDPDALTTFEREWRILESRPLVRTGSAEQEGLLRAEILRCPHSVSLNGIAAQHHVDPRTLRRRLAAEGTSFRTLVDEARAELAIELLADPDTAVDHIARRLGYTGAGNFIRAFKRWTGSTPAAYRRENLTIGRR